MWSLSLPRSLHNHTVVLSAISSYFGEITRYNGICIWHAAGKDAKFLPGFCVMRISMILVAAVLFHILRIGSDKSLCPSLINRWKVKEIYRERFLESMWKASTSYFFFMYSSALLIHRYQYYFRVETVWFESGEKSRSWKPGMKDSLDLRMLFILFIGFYVHSLFCLYFWDRERDDNYVDFWTRTKICMTHHLLVISLSYLALIIPYVRVGICVIFITHICEFQLEWLKLMLYLQDRKDTNPEESRLCGVTANVLCVTLALSWIWFKFHHFVVKVLYMTFPLLHGMQKAWITRTKFPFAVVLNSFLIALWVYNWYWFVFVLSKFYKLYRIKKEQEQSTEKKQEEIDYGRQLFSRFSSFHGWYTFDEKDAY